MGIFDQEEWDVRFEWGLSGIQALAPISDVVIVVDVLRFTTTVTAAIEHGAVVYPFPWMDPSVEEFARTMGAEIAGVSVPGSEPNYSLSPLSMKNIPAGTRLVLPSPNGSALSFEAQRLCKNVLAGCIRNAKAVAEAAQRIGGGITVVAAGERWKHDNSLRPAVEDLAGAGAILACVRGNKSPEARAAESVFRACEQRLEESLKQTSSGKELVERGLVKDILFASQRDTSLAVPILQDDAFIRWMDRPQPSAPGRI